MNTTDQPLPRSKNLAQLERSPEDKLRAEIIRFVADEIGSVIEAARVLPLVGWDADLALAYIAEECEEAQRAASRRGRR